MGRNRTGITTREVRRIELSYLLKKGFIQKDKIIQGTLNWTGGSEIGFASHYTKEKQYFRIYYITTDWQGNEYEYDYKIHLDFIPSNLGKGIVPYFLCPATGNRCRVLYKAYGSHIWKSREAYQHRIYYPSQTSSKLSKMNDKYWQLEKEIEAVYKDTRYQTHYNGKPTRRYKRYLRLLEEQERADFLRWTPQYMPKVMRESFADIYDKVR